MWKSKWKWQWNRHAGKDASELPGGGDKYCQKANEKWSRFEEDIDAAVPLAVREIKCVLEDSKSDTANEGCNWPGSLSYKDLRKAQENVLNSSWINDTSKSRLLTVPKGTWRNSAPRLSDLFYKLLLDFSKRRTTPLRPCAYGQIDQYTRTILQAIRYYLLKMCVSSSIGIDIYNLFLVQYTSITSIEQKNWIYS